MQEEFKKRVRSLGRQNARRQTPRYRSLLLHWMDRVVRPPARARVGPLPIPEAKQVAISFAGHATTLIRYPDLSILCDPILGDWCGTVRREVRPGLSTAELSDIDLILLSHCSRDHLHPKTLARLPRSATVIVPPYTARRVSEFGFARVIELGAEQSVEHRGVDISATAMQHGTKSEPAAAYVIRGDGPSVLFCGASGYFDGFEAIGRCFKPDIAILPIGGYSPSSFRHEHMSPLDALYAFEDLRSKIMIPIRYGAFALSYEHLHAPERWLAELVAERDLEEYVLPLHPGESRIFAQPAKSNDFRVASNAEPAQ